MLVLDLEYSLSIFFCSIIFNLQFIDLLVYFYFQPPPRGLAKIYMKLYNLEK